MQSKNTGIFAAACKILHLKENKIFHILGPAGILLQTSGDLILKHRTFLTTLCSVTADNIDKFIHFSSLIKYPSPQPQ